MRMISLCLMDLEWHRVIIKETISNSQIGASQHQKSSETLRSRDFCLYWGARRISLIDRLSISLLKDILISFPWETETIRFIVEKLVRDKDAKAFATFCEKNKSPLREDVRKVILSCLDTLRFTGVDSEGKRLVLTHIQDRLCIAEFSRDTYSWRDILQDTEETFTVAVVTNTCLSSRPLPEGKQCANGADSSEVSLISRKWDCHKFIAERPDSVEE
ncbi:hypothetical protein BOTNAR_0740g00010 [Botryotinia narcissicola]|uniref:Uncharacterized protein n=1 Tax=Botryotinia narcissicola TaxID=278944 RepID=A0A4Z1H7K8_9HELO|nr:hypothetical protein BOTNAR_0740g00010 [Botryotinia narcissicola]